MRKFIEGYLKSFKDLLTLIEVSGNGGKLDIAAGVEKACKLIKSLPAKGKKALFIGNGGSAGIASHMAVDFWKNGGIKALAFNDSSLLTCLGNDYGYEHVFEKPIEMFAEKGDVLFAISSSGRSKNILKAVHAAKKKGVMVIGLSGFAGNNPLRGQGDINFYVPSNDYGPVETLHQLICHLILDTVMKG